MYSNRWVRVSQVLWLLVWIGLAVYLAFTLWLAFVGLTYPYQLDYGEGIVLWFTQQLAHGHSIYKGLTGLPYASSNYPPLAMLLAALLSPIFGEGYLAGRLLNFAAALVVAALICRIVSVETRTRWAGALGALLFLGSPYVYHWIPQFRADLLGLAFAFSGIFFVWAYTQRPTADRRRTSADGRAPVYFCLFTFAFLLALYTKQTLFAAPAAAFLTLWQRDRRTALAFAIVLGVTGGVIYLAIDAATGGGFSFGLLASNATVFLPELLAQLLMNFAVTFPVLLMLALWGIIDCRRMTEDEQPATGRLTPIVGHRSPATGRSRQFDILEWYAITAFTALVMAGRMGAWENYFLEAIAIACVFAGIAVAGHRSPVGTGPVSGDQRPVFAVVVPVLLLVQLALMWHDPRIAADMVAQDLPANRELAALLARTPGTVISEDMGALTTSGKEVAYYTFQYSSLARSGQWDQSWELNGLRDGAFPLVVLERGTREDVDHYRRFTRDFVSALDRYYAHTQTLGKFEIYTPAPPLHLQAAKFGDEIALVGWSAQPETLKPGTVNLTLVWRAERGMAQSYTSFVHFVNAAGDRIAQDDHAPHNGIYPTTRWAAGEMVRESYTLVIPENLPPGEYHLRVGWYDAEGERLPVPGSADNAVELK